MVEVGGLECGEVIWADGGRRGRGFAMALGTLGPSLTVIWPAFLYTVFYSTLTFIFSGSCST